MSGVLAIDYGSKKSGFAATDALRITSHPLEVARVPGDGEELLAHIDALLAERDISLLLVGMPYHMDGSEGDLVEVVNAFVTRLRAHLGDRLEIVTWDERLTTKEAESRLREAGYRGKEIKARRDSWSALVLLEDWLLTTSP